MINENSTSLALFQAIIYKMIMGNDKINGKTIKLDDFPSSRGKMSELCNPKEQGHNINNYTYIYILMHVMIVHLLCL